MTDLIALAEKHFGAYAHQSRNIFLDFASDYRAALAREQGAQPAPDAPIDTIKHLPLFMRGYDAGLKDGRFLRQTLEGIEEVVAARPAAQEPSLRQFEEDLAEVKRLGNNFANYCLNRTITQNPAEVSRQRKQFDDAVDAIGRPAAAQPAAQEAQPAIKDLRDAKWLDPECADSGCCQSLKFKAAQPAAQEPADSELSTGHLSADYLKGFADGQAVLRPGEASECPYCHDCHHECLYCNGTGRAQPAAQEPNNAEVICPQCCHQFRAIPVDVQRLMLDAGFEPPFTQPPKP